MEQRVAVVGVGQTVQAPVRADVDIAELVLEAVDEALGDAGITLADVENSVTASMDFWDGRTIASMSVAEVVGSYRKSEARTCADAIQAMLYMWTRIATGSFRIGLVAAHCMESRGKILGIEGAGTDPFTQRRLGIDGNDIAALEAQVLLAENRYAPEDAARIVVEARRRGARNPKLAPLPEVTVDEVLSAPTVADPLRALDRAPNRDGAVAFVVVSGDVAKDLDVEPVWVTGMATATGPFWSDRLPGSTAALDEAIGRATSMAGWVVEEADLVEMSTQFSYQHLLFAPSFRKDPFDGTVNSSGGWLAGDPFVVAGASRMAECAHQIRGTAGDRALPGVERAVAHGVHGLAAQTHSVLTMEGGVR